MKAITSANSPLYANAPSTCFSVDTNSKKLNSLGSSKIPTSTHLPALRMVSMASLAVCLLPMHSKLTSAPSPAVRVRISARASHWLGSSTTVAPTSRALALRAEDISRAITCAAPAALAHMMVHRPMVPAPTTTTVWPSKLPAFFTACMPTASGSISAPASAGKPCGSRYSRLAGTLTSSAKAPLFIRPVKARRSQMLYRPWVQ
ncbi:hypothetical protein D9M71_284490 [compost metagenome]